MKKIHGLRVQRRIFIFFSCGVRGTSYRPALKLQPGPHGYRDVTQGGSCLVLLCCVLVLSPFRLSAETC